MRNRITLPLGTDASKRNAPSNDPRRLRATISCHNPIAAQQPDSDHDGLTDELEQTLLNKFAQKFMIGEQESSLVPAECEPAIKTPKVLSENSTIYGQAFPATGDAPTKSYNKTTHALGTSTRNVGKALHIKPKPDAENQTKDKKD